MASQNLINYFLIYMQFQLKENIRVFNQQEPYLLLWFMVCNQTWTLYIHAPFKWFKSTNSPFYQHINIIIEGNQFLIIQILKWKQNSHLFPIHIVNHLSIPIILQSILSNTNWYYKSQNKLLFIPTSRILWLHWTGGPSFLLLPQVLNSKPHYDL